MEAFWDKMKTHPNIPYPYRLFSALSYEAIPAVDSSCHSVHRNNARARSKRPPLVLSPLSVHRDACRVLSRDRCDTSLGFEPRFAKRDLSL
jgi:hypothetical protein